MDDSSGCRGTRSSSRSGYDAFGIHSENYALKVGEHPSELIPRNIDNFRRQLKRAGLMVDWTPRAVDHRPAYYKWTQWVFLQLLQAGAGLQEAGGGQLVPERQDRARQRAGHRRRVRALRHAGGAAVPGAVVLPDHRLRGAAAGQPGPARLVGEHARRRSGTGSAKSEGAEIAFPVQDVMALAGSATASAGSPARSRRRRSRSACSRRGPTRSSARRTSCSRPSIRWSTQLDDRRAARRRSTTYVERAAKQDLVTRKTSARRRPASSPARTRPIPATGAADPDLDRRLRADGVRHRRDHGRARARRARLRVRDACSSCRSCASSRGEGEIGRHAARRRRSPRTTACTLVNSAQFDGMPVAEAKRGDRRLAGGAAVRRGRW